MIEAVTNLSVSVRSTSNVSRLTNSMKSLKSSWKGIYECPAISELQGASLIKTFFLLPCNYLFNIASNSKTKYKNHHDRSLVCLSNTRDSISITAMDLWQVSNYKVEAFAHPHSYFCNCIYLLGNLRYYPRHRIIKSQIRSVPTTGLTRFWDF